MSGFDVRFWYQGQPQACPVCRSFGHRVKDCPFNGLRRRCSQPGHMARECSFRRSSVDHVPAVSSDVDPAPDASSDPVPSDPVAGVDASMSDDEDDPDYVLSSASEPGSCSGDEEVLRSVPTSVLAARARKRPAPPADESFVDLRDSELSPASTVDPVPGTPESASAVVVSVPDPVDPVPVMPESASAVVTPGLGTAPAIPDPVPVPNSVPGTPESASAVVVPDSTPVSPAPKPRKKKPRSSQSAVASSLAKFFSVKSNPVKFTPVEPTSVEPTPAKSTPVESTPAPVESSPVKSNPVKSTSVARSPKRTYWEAVRRTGFGYVVADGSGCTVYFYFGRFSRSIEVESTTFEYDRFVKYVHHGLGRVPVRPPPTVFLPAGTPLEFPKSSG